MNRFALLVVLLVFLSIANAETVTLECLFGDNSKSVFILDVSEKTAQLVTLEGVETGTLQTDENRYQLQLPKSELRWETHIRIERYSGELSWEHGNPPFGELSTENVFRSGECEKISNKPKL
jgi:hypothetical protein